MDKKDSKLNLKHYKDKLENIYTLYEKLELNISLDRLNVENEVLHEIIYFKEGEKKEKKGIFVFSFPYYIKELEDQEFKAMLGQNSLNFKIYNNYSKLRKSCDCKKDCKGVRVNEILNQISWGDNKLVNNPKILRRILTLSYYLGWDLKKDEQSFDTDYFIVIPQYSFFSKPKQRFNLDIIIPICENDDYLLYINKKADLVFIFKNKENFTKADITKELVYELKKEFNIKKINLIEN